MTDLARTGTWPGPADADRATTGRERWVDRAAALDDGAMADFVRRLAEDATARPVLDAVFGNSPYLTEQMLAEPAFFRAVFEEGPDRPVRSLLESTWRDADAEADTDRLMARLRGMKRRAALAIALADIGGLWPLDQVTGALSEVAETALRLAARHLLRRLAASGKLDLPDPEGDPERGSGLIVLGMGKLGGGELNYSSDVDLIVFYDDAVAPAPQPDEMGRLFLRLTRDLVRIMEERTRDGYVFRTDLRLRPDPGATPLAVSVTAAETYYGSLAQNWERAAMIRARPVAGDRAAGKALLNLLQPFVWRKSLDFAAIEDIHAIKRRIHRHKGHGSVRIEGHNVKLGRGGIREIEFFVQTQQMVFGGRQPRLRGRRTRDMLACLAELDRIDHATARDLDRAYVFLRTLEHRLQMVDDQQTHQMPDGAAGVDRIARFMGFDEPAAFRERLGLTMRRVEQAYAQLFEEVPGRTDVAGPDLVFTGADDDPDTIDRLKALGFENVEAVMTTVRGWLAGRYRACRSERARSLLSGLLPRLMSALGRTPTPDTALFRFDAFLGRLPAGIQLFSLFQAHPNLLDLVAEMLGTSGRLADQLAASPNRLDAVLEPHFFDALPSADVLEPELAVLLAPARDYEDVLTILRRWSNDQRFRAGTHVLRGITPGDRAGVFLSTVAEISLRQLLPHVEAEFARRHGRFPEGGMAILALGKLGGREMAIRSDLDLIVIYDAGNGATESDGAKPLSTTSYYTRLAQRLISAITAQTAEGPLYEVDMRLRPSGNAGPVATGMMAFEKYHAESAWTWEHMALIRARVIAGPVHLRGHVEHVIRDTLTTPRDPEKLRRDVADMRRRIEEHHGVAGRPGALWQVKYIRGGLVDVEFAAQYLQLRNAPAHPEMLSPNTCTALDRAAQAGVLDRAAADDLIAAHRLAQRIQSFLRLTQGDAPFDPDAAVAGLREGLARACFPDREPTDDLDALGRDVAAVFDAAYGRFGEIVDRTAGPT